MSTFHPHSSNDSRGGRADARGRARGGEAGDVEALELCSVALLSATIGAMEAV